MHAGVVAGECVAKENLDHVSDFSAESWTVDALPAGLRCVGCERGVGVASVDGLLPLCSQGSGGFGIACVVCSGRCIERYSKPLQIGVRH